MRPRTTTFTMSEISMANASSSIKCGLKSQLNIFQKVLTSYESCVMGTSFFQQKNEKPMIYDALMNSSNRSLADLKTNTTERKPTVILLKKDSSYSCSPKNKVHNASPKKYSPYRRRKGHISTKLLALNKDPDLTLLDNLKWIINFPVRTLFPYVLDEGPGLDNSQSSPSNSQPKFSPKLSQIGVAPKIPGVLADHISSSNWNWSDVTSCDALTSPRTSASYVPSPHTSTLSGGKPTLTYPQLIESCLRENGALTVHEIYRWISNRYPFYEDNDDGWKNVVRHNLSMQSQFKKGEKISGKSHVWYLDRNISEGFKRYGRPSRYTSSNFDEQESATRGNNTLDCTNIDQFECLELEEESYMSQDNENTQSVEFTYLSQDENYLLSGKSAQRGPPREDNIRTDSGQAMESHIQFDINTDSQLQGYPQRQSWEYLPYTISSSVSDAGQMSRNWMQDAFSSVTSEFGEYPGVMENFLPPTISKLETSDLIQEFDVKDVTTDELMKAFDSLIGNAQLT